MGSPSNIITMRTLILSLSLLLVFLDVLVVGDPDIDRTFGIFKKKKEKVKDKIKKPKYNPCSRRSFLLADEMDDIQDRTFKLFHKKREKRTKRNVKVTGGRFTRRKRKRRNHLISPDPVTDLPVIILLSLLTSAPALVTFPSPYKPRGTSGLL